MLPNKTYDDMDMGFETLKIWSADSPITEYVQHPIPIPAPWDKNAVALKPLKLTKQVCLRHRLKSVDISTGTLNALPIYRRRRRFVGTAERPNSKTSKTESGWDSFHQTPLKVPLTLPLALRFATNAVAQFALPT